MKNNVHIALCENTPDDMEAINTHVNNYLERSFIGTEFFCFSSGEEFLAAFKPGAYHLALLDIYMDGIGGIEAAKEIRKFDKNIMIAFITSSKEHALDAFAVNPVNYLIKPITQPMIDEFFKANHLQLMNALNKSSRTLDIVVDRNKLSIPLRKIIYIDVYNHNTIIHTTDRNYTTYLSIDELEAALPSPPFCRCHRCYIVNIEEVKSIRTDFIMSNGETVYIRQSEKKNLLKIYTEYLLKIGRESG